MSQPVVLRPVSGGDAEAIRGIFNWAVQNSTAIMQYADRTPEEQADWLEKHPWETYPALVTCHPEEGTVLGYASLSPFMARPGYRFTAEVSVYVHPDWHGLGIGNVLLTALCREADTRGFVALLSLITADNLASLRLHERHGFFESGRMPRVGFKFGQWLDVVLLQRLHPEVSAGGRGTEEAKPR